MLAAASMLERETSSRRVWLIGAALALIGLVGAPLFENDFYRYLWDGYRIASSGTPYGVPPQAFFADPDVPERFWPVLDRINNPEVPTIYGPVLQGLFYTGYLIDPANERVLRVFWTVANLLLIGVLLRTQCPHRVALYAWNPLVLKEVYLSGHPDVVLSLLLCAGWMLRDRLRGFAFAGALGLAAATKVVALLAAPLLFRLCRPFTAISVMLAAGALCYLPFLLAQGGASELGGLKVFAARWEFNPGPLFTITKTMLGGAAAKAALVLCVGAAAVLVAWSLRPRATQVPPWHRVFGLLLAFSPVVNPWYLLWSLPAAVGSRDLWPWIASGALLLSYATGENLSLTAIASNEVHPIAAAIQWALIVGAVGWDVATGRRSRS